jgi:hypothetical protein
VVVPVAVFLLDDNSKVVLGVCCLPFYEHVGTSCVDYTSEFLLSIGFVAGIEETHSDFWWRYVFESGHLEDQ